MIYKLVKMHYNGLSSYSTELMRLVLKKDFFQVL